MSAGVDTAAAVWATKGSSLRLLDGTGVVCPDSLCGEGSGGAEASDFPEVSSCVGEEATALSSCFCGLACSVVMGERKTMGERNFFPAQPQIIRTTIPIMTVDFKGIPISNCPRKSHSSSKNQSMEIFYHNNIIVQPIVQGKKCCSIAKQKEGLVFQQGLLLTTFV